LITADYVQPIPETVVEGRRLGRHIDLRTAQRRESGGPPPLAPSIISAAHKTHGLPLNQDQTSSCTAHMLCGSDNAIPHYAANLTPLPRTLAEADALKVYSAEEVLLGDGPYPPNDDGGTGVAVCEAAIQLGYASGYQVAANLDEALRALVLRPVGIGINWFTSFDTPSSAGLIEIAPGATVRGGHEIVLVAIDATQSLVWAVQSWGKWGVPLPIVGLATGAFCMSFSTLGTLLDPQNGGDCVVPRTAPGWVAPAVSVAAEQESFVGRIEGSVERFADRVREHI
jgi:uncharacterized protein YciI